VIVLLPEVSMVTILMLLELQNYNVKRELVPYVTILRPNYWNC